MGSVNRTIVTDNDKVMALRLVENRPVPFTLSLTDGKHRSTAQNRLQRLWMNEISQQRGDMTPEEARAYCKLTIGVPLLRAENEAFRQRYDEVLKPLSYEHKLKIMSEPIDLPVTRLMTTKQHTQYLDGIVRHFAEQGIILTMPDDLQQEIQSQSGSSPSSEPAKAEASPLTSAASDDAPSSPSSDASPSPQQKLFPTDRADLIECCQKLMSIPVDDTLETPQAKRGVLVAAKDIWKKQLPSELHDYIRSFFESADAQIKAPSADFHRIRESALEQYAEWLDCRPEEIGG